MKTFFIEARLNHEILLAEEHIKKLPEKIGLVTNIQHLHKLPELKKQLEQHGKKVELIRGFHSRYEGQIYGCDFPAETPEVQAVLFIGTGKFHPRGIFERTEVFVYDPLNRHFYIMDKAEAERTEKKRKAALLKFLHSTEVGVLVSTKPGQLHLRVAEALKKIYPDKNFYFLVCDTVDFSELENFSFVECFVNTACPRLYEDYDKFPRPVVNLEEVMSNLTEEQQAAKEHLYPIFTKRV